MVARACQEVLAVRIWVHNNDSADSQRAKRILQVLAGLLAIGSFIWLIVGELFLGKSFEINARQMHRLALDVRRLGQFQLRHEEGQLLSSRFVALRLLDCDDQLCASVYRFRCILLRTVLLLCSTLHRSAWQSCRRLRCYCFGLLQNLLNELFS